MESDTPAAVESLNNRGKDNADARQKHRDQCRAWYQANREKVKRKRGGEDPPVKKQRTEEDEGSACLGDEEFVREICQQEIQTFLDSHNPLKAPT